ncbi:MAG: putative lipid II flippase FtsW [Gammaproteobacteria bacterium]|nr:putative lipid II flippase FtsW [Gammaproteobacteria bacterium]
MRAQSISYAGRDAYHDRRQKNIAGVDVALLLIVLAIMSLGLVMVTSASITVANEQYGDAFYFLYRQGAYLITGISLAAVIWRLPLKVWEVIGPYALMATLILLVLVLVPGIGKSINGSTRWLGAGGLTFQVSELAKLFVIVYLAGYLTRHAERVTTRIRGFLMPLLVLAAVAFLLLKEPDFGATVVVTATGLFLLFIGGVKLWQFSMIALVAGGALVTLAFSDDYRLKRLISFRDPWADQFDTGYQLTQALIAFGRGELSGVGLGSSVQKLFYLPEAHTDFLMAIVAEELGYLGVLSIILLFALLAWRAIVIGQRALLSENRFGAYIAHGIGFWLVLQALINIGVNMGALPTKGITLPLMSYGGSSVIVSCIAVALLLRVDLETRFHGRKPGQDRRRS